MRRKDVIELFINRMLTKPLHVTYLQASVAAGVHTPRNVKGRASLWACLDPTLCFASLRVADVITELEHGFL